MSTPFHASLLPNRRLADIPLELLFMVLEYLPNKEFLCFRAINKTVNFASLSMFVERFIPTNHALTAGKPPTQPFKERIFALSPMMMQGDLLRHLALVCSFTLCG
jgi:hypothetical protein